MLHLMVPEVSSLLTRHFPIELSCLEVRYVVFVTNSRQLAEVVRDASR